MASRTPPIPHQAPRRPLGGLLIALLLPLLAAAAIAADRGGDRILAVVGKQIFTVRDLDSWVLEARLLNPAADDMTDEEVRRHLLPVIVDDFLLSSWADMQVEDPPQAAIEDRMNEKLTRLQQAAGGRFDLDNILRDLPMDPEAFREWLRARAREELLIRDAITAFADLGGIDPLDTELSQATRIRLAHLLVRWNPDDQAGRDEALRKALLIRRDIESGLPFAEMVRLYSEDEISAQKGGDIGWFDRGSIQPAFLDAVLAVPQGAISQPVEGPAGYHLLRVSNYETRIQNEYRRLMRAEETRQLRRLRTEIGIKLAPGYELAPLDEEVPAEPEED